MKLFFKKLILLTTTILTVSCWSTLVSAACTNYISSVTINAGTITAQRDAAINSSISGLIRGPENTVFSCQDPSGVSVQAGTVSILNATSGSYSGYAVFDSGLPGTGLLFGGYGGFYSGQWSDLIASGSNSVREGAAWGGSDVWNYVLAPQVQFIKTSSMTSGLISKQIGYFRSGWGNGTFPYTTGQSTLVPIYLTATINVVACSITTSNVNVPLDTVLASSFTGVNSTKGDKPFTIGLECDAGARINASLSFTQNTGTSNNSVIQLTGAGTAGVATGVGIQLLYGSTILKNNTNVVLKTTTGGQEFPAGAFTARYFQTAGTVTTGDANATATLNLTYQ